MRLPSELNASAAGQRYCYTAGKRLPGTETVLCVLDYFWMYSAALTKPVILTIPNTPLQIHYGRDHISTEISLGTGIFLLNQQVKVYFRNLQIAKRRLSV